MKAYFFVTLVVCLFLSCERKQTYNSASDFKSQLYNKVLIDSLDNLVLSKGDTLAYFQLRNIYYVGQQRLDGFLYHALIMSNKYGYKKASLDVYDILMFNEQVLDSATKEMANEYLLKSQQN